MGFHHYSCTLYRVCAGDRAWGRAFVYHISGPGFKPQHQKNTFFSECNTGIRINFSVLYICVCVFHCIHYALFAKLVYGLLTDKLLYL